MAWLLCLLSALRFLFMVCCGPWLRTLRLQARYLACTLVQVIMIAFVAWLEPQWPSLLVLGKFKMKGRAVQNVTFFLSRPTLTKQSRDFV